MAKVYWGYSVFINFLDKCKTVVVNNIIVSEVSPHAKRCSETFS